MYNFHNIWVQSCTQHGFDEFKIIYKLE